MKKILFLLLMFTSVILATDVNARLVVIDADYNHLTVLLQINTNTGNDGMGGATIVLGIDYTKIQFPSNGYTFHNFTGGNYSPSKVTNPRNDMVWVNIDLPYYNNNGGTIVSGTNSWTDVVTLEFDLINNPTTIELDWLTTSQFMGIYDDDNTVLWNYGNFENLSVIIDNIKPSVIDAHIEEF